MYSKFDVCKGKLNDMFKFIKYVECVSISANTGGTDSPAGETDVISKSEVCIFFKPLGQTFVFIRL